MNTFDEIEVRRPELARSYLALIKAQPGRPLAMFAPRRVGKTFFLDHDLAPAAKHARWLPVYADLWLQKVSISDLALFFAATGKAAASRRWSRRMASAGRARFIQASLRLPAR